MDKIGLLNRALGFLGERSITSPEAPETQAGKHLVGVYDQCRREVLRRYAWNFAEIWTEVDKTTAPPFGYSDAYSLPEDYLRLILVGEYKSSITDYRLINQGAPDYRRVIALDNAGASKLKIAYGADITLLSLWDPLALKVFALWLALDAAKGTTGQDAQVQLIDKLLSEELKDAVAVDGQEQSVRLNQFSNVQNARDAAQFGSSWTNVTGYR